MKITDLINKEAIDLNVQASSKEDIIKQAVKLMNKNGNIENESAYIREKEWKLQNLRSPN